MDGSLPLAYPLWHGGYSRGILNHDGVPNYLDLYLYDLNDDQRDTRDGRDNHAPIDSHRTFCARISSVTWTFLVIVTLFFFVDSSLFLYYLSFSYLVEIDFFWSVLYIYMN